MTARKTALLNILFFLVCALGLCCLFHDFPAGYFSENDLSRLYLILTQAPETGGIGLDARPDAGHGFQPVADWIVAMLTRCFGAGFVYYLIVNLVLLLINLVLLYRLAATLTNAIAAGACAVLFAVHPMVPGIFSSVVSGIEAGVLLCFTLLCLNAFLAFKIKRGPWRLWAGVLFMALAFLCGTMTRIDPAGVPGLLGAMVTSLDPASPDPESAGAATLRTTFLILPFLCLLLTWLVTFGLRLVKNPAAGKALLLLLLGGICLASGWRTHTLLPEYVRPGKQIKKMRSDVIDCLDKYFSPQDPIYLMDTPRPAPPPFQRWIRRDKTPCVSLLSLAFSPPFHDEALRIYPFFKGDDRDDPLYTTFMFHTWGSGKVLRYDPELDRFRKLKTSENDPALLAPYLKKYGKDKKVHLMDVQYPAADSVVLYDVQGFRVSFPFRMAAFFRVALLTRAGPFFMEASDLFPDRIERQGKKPYVKLQFSDPRLRAALLYFNREPVCFWVDAVDDQGEAFFRSRFIRFRLLMR